MKKKLIILLALCFAFSTVVHATENFETVVEEGIESEFSLFVETVTEVDEETETVTEETATEVTIDIIEDKTEEMLDIDTEEYTHSETIEEITETLESETEIEATTEAVVEEPSDAETEVESESDSIQIGEITEVESGEVSTETLPDFTEETEPVETVVNDVVIATEITDESKRIFVQVTGENLIGKCANIKVRPINTYNDFCYIRTTVFDDDVKNTAEILMSDNMSGLYRVEVDVENIVRETKVVIVEESSDNELICTTDRNSLIITGNITTEEEKDINVKVLSESGNIVFIRSVKTEVDGSYAVNVVLSGEDENYVVWVTVDGESKGYVKLVSFFSEDSEKKKYYFTCQSGTGAYEEVFVYAKNILGANNYVYEIDYSEHMKDVKITDLCTLTREKEQSAGYCYNTEIEILSASDGKIRFIVNSEAPADKVWSGLLNILKFERITSNSVTFTLRVYE